MIFKILNRAAEKLSQENDIPIGNILHERMII
jgi:hypothetical protein